MDKYPESILKKSEFVSIVDCRILHNHLEGLEPPSNSDDMDGKIISHLRRHLSKRTQKTIDQRNKVADDPEEGDMTTWESLTGVMPIQEESVNTIFTSYSETGEKFKNGNMLKSLKTPPNMSQSNLSQSARPKHDDISRTIISSASKIKNNAQKLQESNTRDRLQLREKTKIALSEKMDQILDGYLHNECPSDETVYYLYIASGNTDMEGELTFMQQHLYPELRSQFLQNGQELRIIDLHWGFKDALSDDHQILEVIRRAVTKARGTTPGIKCVILLGQKYGSNILPSEIPKDEFESILMAATACKKKDKMILRAALREIESLRSDRETEKVGETIESKGQKDQQTKNGGATEHPLLASVAPQTEKRTAELTADQEPQQQDNVTSIRDEQAAKMLREAEDQLPDTKALRQWYLLDENAVPPVYRLQNISTFFKDILRNDASKRQAAKMCFAAIESRLLKILETFAPVVTNNQETTNGYMHSLLDLELHKVRENRTDDEHTVCVVRTIDQLTNRLEEQSVGDYIDLVPGNQITVDADKCAKIESFRKAVLNGQMSEQNILSCLVDYGTGGIRPGRNRDHLLYLERVCESLFDQIVDHLVFRNVKTSPDTWKSRLFSEVSQHVRQCYNRASEFEGRRDILALIKSYLESDTRRPLVVYGKSGCGKSSVLGKSATEINEWFKSDQVKRHVLVRMVGCTASSTNVRSLLRDISLQLCHVFGKNTFEVPMDVKGVFNDLGCRLSNATEDKAIVIILDGVDRLSDEYDGRRLMWLPTVLPPYVHLIISTSSDEKCPCLPSARDLLDGHINSFLEIGQLRLEEAVIILKHRLNLAKRCLTSQQNEILLEAFTICPYPLFLKVAISDALRWASYVTPNVTKLGETVKSVINVRYGRLERDHGEPLTRRALGYITAARHGLTSNELEDIISVDDAVMDDVMATFKLPRRRLPPLLWVRFLEDIDDLVSDCWADNMKTIMWAHAHVREVAEDRYLSQRDKAPSYHKALAGYFNGVCNGNPKQQNMNEKRTEGLPANHEDDDKSNNYSGNSSDPVYTLRALNELPYHLMKGQMSTQLKQSCLCNYEWMLARLCGSSLESLLEEYQSMLLIEPGDLELRVLMDVLILSMNALQQEPRQLASQLVGRLHRIVTADNPRSPGDPKKYPNLHTLLSAAKQSYVPVLIPSTECLTEPGGISFDLLSGHTSAITAVTLTSDGMRALTTSEDGTLKLWDIRSGKVIKSIIGVQSTVFAIRSAKANTLAITVEGSHIKIWDINGGRCVFTISQYADPANISVTDEGMILAAVYDGSNIFRSWNTESFVLLCETHIPDISVHKDNSILIAAASSGPNVLHAFRSGCSATVRNARNGQVVKNLQCHNKPSSIVALTVSSEYFILCCKQQHVALHEIQTLELFDAAKGTYIRSVQGCPNDNIRQITTNLAGSHAVAISPNVRNKTSDVVLFNLETEEHKHLAPHSGIGTMCACLDFRYCLTGVAGDRSLKIWNFTSKINLPVSKLKKQFGLADIWPMIDNPRYVLAKAVNNGPVSVWNVTKGKCLQSAVRIERGLTEGSDALVTRNTRLVILTDRGLSNVSDDPVQVFQTVLVYDLKLKKYIRKLSGCYIVPAPSQDYTLLDNDSLLGLSDNRSHFIIWNLVSGHAVFRIKTGFKELETMKLERGIQFVDITGAKRRTSSKMAPRQKRSESRQDKKAEIERQRHEWLRKEKNNVIDQFLVSGNQAIIVASFYAHHMCVYDVRSPTHIHTLQTEYSMLFLHTSALTFDGGHLVHANYDEISKTSYVTLWDCTTGEIQRRLKGEKDVCAIAITDDAQRVVIGRLPNEIHVWDSMKSNSLRRIRGYNGLKFEIGSKIFMVGNGEKAVVFAGDISVWDLANRILLTVFSPDARISVCNVVLNGKLILFGMFDKPALVVLKLTSSNMKQGEDTDGVELFGETTGDTPDEDEDDDEDKDESHEASDDKMD